MNTRAIAGRVDSALAHFSLVGLAAIVDHATTQSSRIWWSDEQLPRPTLATVSDDEAVAAAVLEHAARHIRPDSWLTQRVAGGTRDRSGVFTARAKVLAVDEWESYVDLRRETRLHCDVDTLDGRVLQALGEPAWWRCSVKESRPDDGASRWEMKTRNQGQEFIVHRLSPLAEAVSRRSRRGVLDGLLGDQVCDETGNDSAVSRTATGLTTPGPVDSLVAWCALWGLHVAPTVSRKATVSQSPGVWPRRQVHPRVAAVPVFTRPVSVRRFSQVLCSRPFDLAGEKVGRIEVPDEEVVQVAAAAGWLREQGVKALVRFPVLKTGSSSAPERQLLSGEVHVL